MREDGPPRSNGRSALPRSREEELESALQDRDRRLTAVYRQLADREAMIAQILGSRSWRLVRLLQGGRERLLPKGSARVRLLRTALSRAARVGAAVRRLARSVGRPALWRGRGQAGACEEGPLPEPPIGRAVEHIRHAVAVDIVICVHDALPDVKACLESLVRTTAPPYRLVLVDDGSAPATRDLLAEFAADQAVTLVRNESARGYTVAANQGLRETTGEYVVLLNSDAVLTPGWLDRMVACAESDAGIGIVGPLSNTASWQSVPTVFGGDGDWAANPLPAGETIDGMARLVAQASPGLYPRIPFLNGFCLLIRRRVIEAIGLLDEATFPMGYGEENDYCIRARRAGFSTAVAGDAYVWHAQSRSFSHEERKRLVRASDQVTIAKYGEATMRTEVEASRTDRVLEGIRTRVAVARVRAELIEAGRSRWEGRRLAVILPIAEPGGGGHVVMQEALAMLRMGVDVRLVNRQAARIVFQQWHQGLEIPQIYVGEPSDIPRVCSGFDAVVATVYFSVPWMDGFVTRPMPVRGYYVQDFEPAFFPPGTPDHAHARLSYTRIPDLVRFTKTEWNRATLEQELGVDCTVVGPSVDLDLFQPRPRSWRQGAGAPLRIAAMVRPMTPRRQPALTMEVLRKLVARHHRDVEVIVFGCEPTDEDFRKLSTDFTFRNAGMLTRPGLAALLNEVDVFADFSAFQAMGLTAMEAMACGATAILPRAGGAGSFARDGQNALVVDTSEPGDCLAALARLSEDRALCRRLGRQAMLDMCEFPPERAAYKILATLFPDEGR